MAPKVTIIWKPNPGPQTEALKRHEREILFGGARGGGKTQAGIAWLLRWYQVPEFRFLVIRRNSQDLADWIDRAKQLWRFTGAEFVQGEVRFPSGAIGRFGHLCDDDAYEKYQGHEYQKIVIEELTHIPNEELYIKLISSCRSTVPGLKPQVFCTTNPGNAGNSWVKARFVTSTDPGTRYTDDNGNTRIFIPATVEDNPALMKADPGYVKWLDSLPEDLRKIWREGSWDNMDIKGAYYSQIINKMKQDGHITKVPWARSSPVRTWWDLGMDDATAIGFFQKVGAEWRMIDYYEAEGEGMPYYAEVLREKGYIYDAHYMPHDVEVRELSNGLSRKDTAENLGIKPIHVVPRSDIYEGINAVRMKLPNLFIDQEKCATFIDAISQYRKQWDEKKNTFRARPLHDWTSHSADMIRYWAVSDEPILDRLRNTSERWVKKIKRSRNSAVVY